MHRCHPRVVSITMELLILSILHPREGGQDPRHITPPPTSHLPLSPTFLPPQSPPRYSFPLIPPETDLRTTDTSPPPCLNPLIFQSLPSTQPLRHPQPIPHPSPHPSTILLLPLSDTPVPLPPNRSRSHLHIPLCFYPFPLQWALLFFPHSQPSLTPSPS